MKLWLQLERHLPLYPEIDVRASLTLEVQFGDSTGGNVKFMNFSRKNAPSVIRLGAVFGDSCFDITKAIGDDLLEFPRVVFTIEEVLQVKDGLQLLEDQLKGLRRASSGIQSYLFTISDVSLHAPI